LKSGQKDDWENGDRKKEMRKRGLALPGFDLAQMKRGQSAVTIKPIID
jgi:hypothetical protein